MNRRRLEELGTEQAARLTLVYGHFGFGVHSWIPRPCTYLTVLREPTSRVVSCYRHAVDLRHRRDLAELPAIGLRGFVETERIYPPYHVDNGQIRALCGSRGALPEIPKGEVQRHHLERAKAALEDCFSVVGLTERFDETVVLIRKTFGWRLPLVYAASNPSRHVIARELDEDLMQLIARMNALDLELYEWCRRRFERRLADIGDELQASLRAQKRLNRLLGPAVQRLDSTAARLLRGRRAAPSQHSGG
jgi:hypothetical protein